MERVEFRDCEWMPSPVPMFIPSVSRTEESDCSGVQRFCDGTDDGKFVGTMPFMERWARLAADRQG